MEDEKNSDPTTKLTYELLAKKFRVSVAQRLQAGDTNLIKELEYLKKIDSGEKVPEADLNKFLDPENDSGIPERLKVSRKYTMSPEALESRRRNAQRSTGPQTEEGKRASSRNGWKHGRYASSFLMQFAKPCRTTCPKYPCSVVNDGATEPGMDCLDKEHFIEACAAIERALRDKSYDDFNELSTVILANNIQIIRKLQEDILQDGTLIKSEKVDKDGAVIGHEFKLHPALLALPKFLADLGFTPSEFLMTPRSRKRVDIEDEGVKDLAGLFGMVHKAMKTAKPKEAEDAD